MVFYQGSLSLGSSVLRVVFFSGWSSIRVSCHLGGLLKEESFIRVSCEVGGLSLGVSCHRGSLLSG